MEPEVFERLNESLFRAYFSEGKNIGDADVLRKIAEEAGVPADTVARAWSDPKYEERLAGQHEAASRVGVTGIPTFVIGNRWIVEGAVPTELLTKAAREPVPTSHSSTPTFITAWTPGRPFPRSPQYRC